MGFVREWLLSFKICFGQDCATLRHPGTRPLCTRFKQTRAEPRAKYYNCAPQRRTGARFDKPKLLSAVLTPIWADVG
jgi:hypothetical protein